MSVLREIARTVSFLFLTTAQQSSVNFSHLFALPGVKKNVENGAEVSNTEQKFTALQGPVFTGGDYSVQCKRNPTQDEDGVDEKENCDRLGLRWQNHLVAGHCPGLSHPPLLVAGDGDNLQVACGGDDRDGEEDAGECRVVIIQVDASNDALSSGRAPQQQRHCS